MVIPSRAIISVLARSLMEHSTQWVGKDLGMAEEVEVSSTRVMCLCEAKLYLLIEEKSFVKTV